MYDMRSTNIDKTSLKELVEWTKLDSIVLVEVGSYAGQSAELFVQTGKVKQIWCIDPWQPGYDCTDEASSSDFTEVEQAFGQMMARHPTVVHKFKGTLQEFVKHFPQVCPDIVYIDAMHQYEPCRADINSALKLCPGYVAGHDYSAGWSGVMKAVDEVFAKPDHVFVDSSWIVDIGARTLYVTREDSK